MYICTFLLRRVQVQVYMGACVYCAQLLDAQGYRRDCVRVYILSCVQMCLCTDVSEDARAFVLCIHVLVYTYMWRCPWVRVCTQKMHTRMTKHMHVCE